MLYVLILYCSGICPAWMPPPSDVLFFSSLADCKKALAQNDKFLSNSPIVGADGKVMKGTREKQTCATIYADPGQLDRILDPVKLQKLLNDRRSW